MKNILILMNIVGFEFSICPDGFTEDDCGNCWMPYCYDYVNHEL